jgi:hypothetical protein
MIRKGQLNLESSKAMSFVEQFYALAGQIRPVSSHHRALALTLVFLPLMRQIIHVRILVEGHREHEAGV